MAIAALPAAIWWALGSSAAGGIIAKQRGGDWRKGAALGALGGLGLSAALAPAAAAGAGASAAGAGVAGTTVGGTGATLAGSGTGGLLAGAGGAGASAAAATSGAVKTTLFADMLKSGVVAAGTNAALSAMQPDVEMGSPSPQPFQMSQEDPNSVFQIIRELQRRKQGIV